LFNKVQKDFITQQTTLEYTPYRIGDMKTITILAIPGSLREQSSSYKILELLAASVPKNIEFSIYKGVGTLPHFDDREIIPDTVIDFREKLSDADGILICMPEYAFGVPGSLKNALDWTVGSSEFVNKPVALITASSSGEKAHASMLFTLTAINAKVPEGGSLLIPFIRSKFNAAGEAKDVAMLGDVKHVLNVLIHAAEEYRKLNIELE
jgi:chromate reductase